MSTHQARNLLAPIAAQTELVELTAELMSGAGGAHIGYEARPSPTPLGCACSHLVNNACKSTIVSKGLCSACKRP